VENSITGQWIGFDKDDTFHLVNLGVRNGKLEGRVSSHIPVTVDGKQEFIWTWNQIEGIQTLDGIQGSLVNRTLHNSSTGKILNEEQVKYLFQTVTDLEFPANQSFRAHLAENNILKVKTVAQYSGDRKEEEAFEFKRAKLDISSIEAQAVTWEDFKKIALTADDGKTYRGQAQHWPLQTSFHRTGRADITAYLDNEVMELERTLNAHTSHVYKAKDEDSLGALLNLAQHHGYPTPLLDWTRSAFVAAFFAFEDSSKLEDGGHVTIFCFDEEAWSQKSSDTVPTRTPAPILRSLTLPSYGNPRVLPQQSITMFSNISDIELIIQLYEKDRESLLTAYKIPVADRDIAMRELSKMGITWASLFPSIDGMCKHLRFQHFDKI